jgi:hypothetical protein
MNLYPFENHQMMVLDQFIICQTECQAVKQLPKTINMFQALFLWQEMSVSPYLK